jgi:hypothetical protein
MVPLRSLLKKKIPLPSETPQSPHTVLADQPGKEMNFENTKEMHHQN